LLSCVCWQVLLLTPSQAQAAESCWVLLLLALLLLLLLLAGGSGG
jgi:hypothetical protein